MRRKKRSATEGYAFMFHGSYSSKEKAEAKARKRDGFLISRIPRGMRKRRYIVLTERVPFCCDSSIIVGTAMLSDRFI